MHYLVLLHDTEGPASVPGSAEWDAEVAEFVRFEEIAGHAIVGGEALAPSSESVVIRPATGQVTDGAFTETAEVLGGTFVFEADDLDAVLELAAAIPTARTGTLEVRPLHGDWTPPADPPEGTTRYLAMLHARQDDADVKGTPAWDAAIVRHQRFIDEHGDRVLGGAELALADTATTLRVRDGEVQLTDGPFAETAEVAGGFYLLAAASRDDAIATASAIPVDDGAVELRPIVEMDG